MPYALILIGIIMVVTGAQNTHVQLATQIRGDAVGFTKYAIAFGVVGAAGYVEDLRGLSRAFMGLILLSLILGNKGFFSNLLATVNQGPALISPAADGSVGSSGSGVASGSGAPVSHGPFGNNVPSQQGGFLNWLTTPPSATFSNPFAGMFGQPNSNTPGNGAVENSPTLPF